VDVPPAVDEALAQPTRARLFAALGELKRAAPTEELAERVGMHPNGVRLHLERLERAGLLERRRERRNRGRPRDTWSISAGAQPGREPPTAYADLGRWLARVVADESAHGDSVEATGRQIGRELAPDTSGASPEQRLHGVLVAMGFKPGRRVDDPTTLSYCLGNCPYRAAVRERQAVVCGLHRGITRGLLDEISPRTRMVAFVPKDPDAAGCEITVRGPLVDNAVRPSPPDIAVGD
jgi:predicted ArsR family transcriptional regulator